LSVLALLGGLTGASASAQSEGPEEPRYLRAVRQELERVGAEAICESEGRARARCRLEHRATEGDRRWPVQVVISEQAETVTLVVLAIARFPPDEPTTERRLRHLAELNWGLHGAQLEWDPRTGVVRLSAVQRTDSNFDRRAFRVLLRLLLSQAERLTPQLR